MDNVHHIVVSLDEIAVIRDSFLESGWEVGGRWGVLQPLTTEMMIYAQFTKRLWIDRSCHCFFFIFYFLIFKKRGSWLEFIRFGNE